jgi:hypothetical protein
VTLGLELRASHRGKLFKNFLKAGGRNDPRINLDFVRMAARGRKQKATLL